LQYLLDARNEDNIYDKNESKVLEWIAFNCL
jgi:hypothetical protein